MPIGQKLFFRMGIILLQVSLAGALLFSIIVLASPSAQAAANIPAKKCAVTWIYLHGSKPANIICHQWQTGTGKTPDTQTGNCPGNAEIDSHDNGRVCFIGSGYLGLSGCCTYVYFVEFYHFGGWVLYYYHGSYPGKKYYFSQGEFFGNQYPFDGTNNAITQICVYYSNGTGC